MTADLLSRDIATDRYKTVSLTNIFTQNFEPIYRKICILWGVKNLASYDF